MRNGRPSASIARSSAVWGTERPRRAAVRMRPLVRRKLLRRNRLRVGRSRAEIARAFECAEQHLDEVQCAAGVEAVAVRRNTAHRVHRDRPAGHAIVLAPPQAGPAHRQRDRFIERTCAIRAQVFGWYRRHTASLRHLFRRVLLVQIALAASVNESSPRDRRERVRPNSADAYRM